ncbi:hypothetical protein DFH29DRAFT_1007171 [Suillus ampliporus]|nr:hypothetical protein DFH29DRAFT_1007171 [Suillus ampliporus]
MVSADDLGLEELRELQEDKDANEDLEYQDYDVDEDIYMVDQQEDIKICEAPNGHLMTSASRMY